MLIINMIYLAIASFISLVTPISLAYPFYILLMVQSNSYNQVKDTHLLQLLVATAIFDITYTGHTFMQMLIFLILPSHIFNLNPKTSLILHFIYTCLNSSFSIEQFIFQFIINTIFILKIKLHELNNKNKIKQNNQKLKHINIPQKINLEK